MLLGFIAMPKNNREHPECDSVVKTTKSLMLPLLLTSSQPWPLLGHSMNHISQDPSFRGASTLSKAPGTHLRVTHSSLVHRGQPLCACYWPLHPCNGHWSIFRLGRGLWGQRCVWPCNVNLLRHIPMGALELSEM